MKSKCFRQIYFFILLIYKKFFSPFISKRVRCRFYPTCSEYSKLAVKKHGLIKGLKLTTIRLKKCNPNNFDSVIDFPPEIF